MPQHPFFMKPNYILSHLFPESGGEGTGILVFETSNTYIVSSTQPSRRLPERKGLKYSSITVSYIQGLPRVHKAIIIVIMIIVFKIIFLQIQKYYHEVPTAEHMSKKDTQRLRAFDDRLRDTAGHVTGAHSVSSHSF